MRELAKSQSARGAEGSTSAAVGAHHSDESAAPSSAKQPERSLHPMSFLKSDNAEAVKLASANSSNTPVDKEGPGHLRREGSSLEEAAKPKQVVQYDLEKKRELQNYKKEFARYVVII